MRMLMRSRRVEEGEGKGQGRRKEWEDGGEGEKEEEIGGKMLGVYIHFRFEGRCVLHF